MKFSKIVLVLVLVAVFISPTFASAATNAGIKPGSFWYGFDIAFEKINLFFTFNSESKARKALQYADERLAEVEAVAESGDIDAVKTAITNYESNIAFAVKKSKDVAEKEKVEELLALIADDTSKHQKILADVLVKVPNEAKEVITNVIEVSRKGQEEAMKQTAGLRDEIEELKKEVTELKQGDNAEQTAEIEKLKKEMGELKKKPIPTPIPTPAPVISVPKQTPPEPPINTQSQTTTPTPPSIQSWSELESREFFEANQKEWTTLIITNALGEKRYYRKEGSLWVRKNSEAEMKQAYAPLPTTEQLRKIRRVCLLDENAPICTDENFMPGYISNLTFRMLMDPLINQVITLLEAKKSQQFAAEIKTLDCLMAPTPDDERVLDPATQNYLRQVRCGTVTDADRTNYELSRIKSSVDELKYRLETKTSFPPVLFDTLKPIDWGNRWEIRWDGFGGGTIKDSTGGFYQFRCEANYCVSY